MYRGCPAEGAKWVRRSPSTAGVPGALCVWCAGPLPPVHVGSTLLQSKRGAGGRMISAGEGLRRLLATVWTRSVADAIPSVQRPGGAALPYQAGHRGAHGDFCPSCFRLPFCGTVTGQVVVRRAAVNPAVVFGGVSFCRRMLRRPARPRRCADGIAQRCCCLASVRAPRSPR